MRDDKSYDHRKFGFERERTVVSTIDSQGKVHIRNETTKAMLEKTKGPTLRSLLVRRIVIAIINYALLAFFEQCLSILLPLMYSTSLNLGGFGFNTFTIGIVLGLWGVANGLFSIVAFPRLLRKFGYKRLYIASAVSSLLCAAMFPIMSHLAKHS